MSHVMRSACSKNGGMVPLLGVGAGSIQAASSWAWVNCGRPAVPTANTEASSLPGRRQTSPILATGSMQQHSRLDGWSSDIESPRCIRADRGPGRICIEELGLIRDLDRHPSRKRDFHQRVFARCSVALMEHGQVLGGELATDTCQCRPKAAMDERDPGGNEATHEDRVLSSDRARDAKDVLGTRV